MAAPRRATPGRLWVVAALALIGLIALLPQPGSPSGRSSFLRGSWVPASPNGWLDLFGNIILYVPLGLSLASQGMRLRTSVAAGAAVSFATEIAQFTVPGRDPAIRDLTTNTIGTLIGAAVYYTSVGRRIVRGQIALQGYADRAIAGEKRTAEWTVVSYSSFLLVLLNLSGWLLQPEAFPGERYFVPGPSIDRTEGPGLVGGSGKPGAAFKGLIDDVRIYARALEPFEIARDMKMPVGRNGENGSVAAFAFDEGQGSTARDASESRSVAHVRGVRWGRGRFGTALAFDGSSAGVPIDLPDIPIRAVTLEAWVLPEPSQHPLSVVVALPGMNFALFGGSPSGDRPPAVAGNFDGEDEVMRGAEPMTAGEWTHLASTYDGEVIRLFVNGTLVQAVRRWSSHQPVDVTLNGKLLAFGRFVPADPIAAAMRSSVDLDVAITCGTIQEAKAPMFRLVAPGNREPLAIRSEADDVLVQSATKSSLYRLGAPVLRVRDALSSCRDRKKLALRLTGGLQNPHIEIDNAVRAGEGLGLASAWAFLVHVRFLPSWMQTASSIFWLMGLVIPLGLVARTGWVSAICVATVAAAFILVPMAWHLPPVTFSQTLAIVAAAAVGLTMQRRIRAAKLPRT